MSDVDSLSPTPSQENLANIMDASMYNAIDTFMAQEEQSYDNFMKQFTHLTHDDIKAKLLSKQKAMLQKVQVPSTKLVTKETKAGQEDTTSVSNVTREGDEDLEEEVLDFGTTSSIMSSAINPGPTRSSVQFDNFVEIDSNSDEDFLEGSEYVASFAGQNSDQKSQASHCEPPTNEEDNQRELTPTTLNGNERLAVREVTPAGINEDNSTDCGDLINPGEVEVLPSVTPATQKDRILDFSAREGTPVSTESDDQVCHDEVEPFSLDKDFDYDNVILTPKFSAEDVELMKSLREQNQGGMSQGSNENET